MTRRTETITVTYDDHGDPVDPADWGYVLRMGGLDVYDDDVRVRRRLGTKTPEPKVHYASPTGTRLACGRASVGRETVQHDKVTCSPCLNAIKNFPNIFPDSTDRN